MRQTTDIEAGAVCADRFSRWQHQVDVGLDEAIEAHSGVPARLADAMRHAALARGKRVRAVLMLALANDLGLDEGAVLAPAVAVELIHAASLVLDDVPCMDDAAKRRHQPATHRVFGEATAILAAVSLVAKSYEVIASASALSGETRSAIVAHLAEAMGAPGLCGGQQDDLEADAAIDTDAVLDVYARKTGALFALSLAAPCLVAQSLGRTDTRNLAAAGRRIGVAFQIYDDLVDVLASDSTAGKDVRKDARKPTVCRLEGFDGALGRADAEIMAALREIGSQAGDGAATAFISRMVSQARERVGLGPGHGSG
ncbi:MAG: polyprenyl synthetase family protein [Rhizobiales bacterium]|nr:polyprenyl synthetase family protein [Hyphomicrobiales bacterium]